MVKKERTESKANVSGKPKHSLDANPSNGNKETTEGTAAAVHRPRPKIIRKILSDGVKPVRRPSFFENTSTVDRETTKGRTISNLMYVNPRPSWVGTTSGFPRQPIKKTMSFFGITSTVDRETTKGRTISNLMYVKPRPSWVGTTSGFPRQPIKKTMSFFGITSTVKPRPSWVGTTSGVPRPKPIKKTISYGEGPVRRPRRFGSMPTVERVYFREELVKKANESQDAYEEKHGTDVDNDEDSVAETGDESESVGDENDDAASESDEEDEDEDEKK